jgi:LEA14-like dessication related protein|tara:strand:- start:459 stop:1331 length:873 start_codon:yes stop_codon:yes gene_type:complete
MKAIFYLLIISSFILIGACSSIQEPKLISIDKVELIDDTDEEFSIETDLSIYNPNWFDISTDDIAFKIFVNTIYVGSAEIAGGVLIAKKDTSNVVSLLKIQKNYLDSNININDSVLVNAIGTTKIPYINKDFYFEFDYKINLSDYILPFANEIITDSDIQIKEVNIKSIDLMKIKLEVLFNLNNTTKNEYEISKLDVSIYNSSSYSTLVGRSTIDKGFTVLADTLNVFESEVSINTLSMGSAIFSNTISNSNSFYIKVNSIVNYNKLEIPIVIKRRIDYNPLTLEIKLHE